MAVEMKFSAYVKNPDITSAMLVTPEILKLLPTMSEEDIDFIFGEKLYFESAGDYVILTRVGYSERKEIVEVGSYFVHTPHYNSVYRASMFSSYVKVEESNE